MSLLCASGMISGCSKQVRARGAEHGYVNACTLLTAEEIRLVQGAPLTEAKASGNAGSDFTISQCYFATTDPGGSIALTVTRQGKGWSDTAARLSWNRIFHPEPGEGKEQASDEEQHEEPAPQKVLGLGDEAFWIPNQFGGALYVLKQDYHVRISLGGNGNPETKRRKSRTLVELVLKRL